LAHLNYSFGIFLLLVAAACQAKATPITREPLVNISHIEIRRGYSSYKVKLDNPEQVQTIVAEINQVRQKPWNVFIGKPGACAMHLMFFRNNEQLPFYLMVGAKAILEVPIAKKQPRYFLKIDPQDIPRLRTLVLQIGLPGNCKW